MHSTIPVSYICPNRIVSGLEVIFLPNEIPEPALYHRLDISFNLSSNYCFYLTYLSGMFSNYVAAKYFYILYYNKNDELKLSQLITLHTSILVFLTNELARVLEYFFV